MKNVTRAARLALVSAAVLTPVNVAVGAALPKAQKVATGVDRHWLFVDREGTTHLTFITNTPNQSTLRYTRAVAGASVFEAPREIPVTGLGTDFFGPQIVQDAAPSSRLVIVTERCCTTGQAQTFAVTSVDGGATWSASVPVAESSPAANATDGAVSLIANGPAGLFMINGNPSTKLIKVPATLTPVALRSALTEISPAALEGSVVFDTSAQPVFSFGDFTKTYVRVGEAGANVVASEKPENGVTPSIKIANGAGGVGVLLGGGSATAETLTFRRLVGGALTAPVALTSAGDRDQGYPFLSSDVTGRFHVVWRDATGGIVYRTSSDGSVWTPQGVVARGTNVVNPEVAAGPGSKGFVAWRDLGSDLFVTPLPVFGTSSDPAVPDTSGIDGPRVTRRGSSIFVTPRRPSLAKLKKSKCVNVRVQSTRPARINVAIFSGRKSIRIFGQTVVRFNKPGTRLVCVRVPLRAKSFDVRQPFRFAFAVKDGATAKPGEKSGKLTTTSFTNFA